MNKPQKTKNKPLVVKDRFIRIAPRKLRLVAGPLLGKSLSQAIEICQFSPKAAAKRLLKVLKNAQNLAKERNLDSGDIKTIAVNEGPKLKRRRIIHRGRSREILKRMSHITITLSSDGNLKSKVQNAK